MSDASFRAEWDIKKKIAMGERVGGLTEYLFMQETAMVHLEEREFIAYCKGFGILFPQAKRFIKFLEEKAIPVLTVIGRGRWYRDTITDLALALSKSGKKIDSQDAVDILEEKIEK